ncbi:hypothetical protein M2323_004333 [Rhodoblastus acidophilus]|uniref:carbohydrate porin n=1 Tax=Rhodoblastus acidophilus TaxID=1074 RepID=UPI0022257286|nr:carbohydrate porin [Rhodoblastus acidophilus]MCW2286536.1 hypothetical protein [Rhodoblastus acidophilus]MCW2335385.1 hypothetical protein [Rhodoblastus acidophilus]
MGSLLPGTLRIGGWSHFGCFADERFASDGGSIWDPGGSGSLRQHRGDLAFYGILDRQV